MDTVIWHFLDGKPGHDNQSTGLVNALRELRAINVHVIDVTERHTLWGLLLLLHASYPGTAKLPTPKLLIGAGHNTHAPLLSARRGRGGHAIVLMKPSLPTTWFDLCVVPAHDTPISKPNLLITQGVLNKLRPARNLDAKQGLILLGGPSAHYHWHEEELISQLRAVLQNSTLDRWTVATSRRTPASTVARLNALGYYNTEVVTADSVDHHWLPLQLKRCGVVWVSEDSVSMVFEALTAGAATGLLQLNPKQDNHVRRGVMTLADEGTVTRFEDWREGKTLTSPAQPFDESARVAGIIAERWL
tara:strand:- start:69 stop:977 length:909 start_codon:yes stop_codon:yes gene_type:complete